MADKVNDVIVLFFWKVNPNDKLLFWELNLFKYESRDSYAICSVICTIIPPFESWQCNICNEYKKMKNN
jgi:hypothetical protein